SGSSSSSIVPPALVTHATSGAKPSMCSASFIKYSRGISSGKAQFSCPLSLIMSSNARMIASHIAQPYGRTTIMPRTPDQSASSALRTTSVYQRSKSSDILVMSFTKSCCSSTVSFIPVAPRYPGDRSLRTPARVRGLGRERSRRSRGVLGRDGVDLSQQHGQKLLLGHCLVQLTPLENHPLAAPSRHADVGMTRLGRAVDHTAHDRDSDRNLQRGDVGLDRLHGGHHVVLEPATRRARHQSRAFVAEGERLQNLVRDANLF